METLLTHELIMKYITGSASDAEQAMVEEAVAESDDCMRQVRSYLYLRENFDSIWDTISAKKMGELYLEAIAAATPPSFPQRASSEKEPVVIRLRVYRDNQGQVKAEGAENWRVIIPLNVQQLSDVACTEESKKLGIAMNGESQAVKTSAVWNIPLGTGEDAVEVTAADTESCDLWKISFNPKYKHEKLLSESRLRVLTDSGKEMLNYPLRGVVTISLKTSLWRVEIYYGNEKRFLEIDLNELKRTD